MSRLMFGQVGMRLDPLLRTEAKVCVAFYGKQGKGDEYGSRFIDSCFVEYVQQCVERAVKAEANEDRLQLQRWLNAVTQ